MLDLIHDLSEILAAVAVVASLLFVGLQIRQNTTATLSQTHQWLFQDETKLQVLLLTNPDVAALVVKGEANPDQLSEIEWTRFSQYALLRFGLWEAAHLSHESGLMRKNMLEVWNMYFSDRLTKPGYRAYWRENHKVFMPTFRGYADAEVYRDNPDQVVPPEPAPATDAPR